MVTLSDESENGAGGGGGGGALRRKNIKGRVAAEKDRVVLGWTTGKEGGGGGTAEVALSEVWARRSPLFEEKEYQFPGQCLIPDLKSAHHKREQAGRVRLGFEKQGKIFKHLQGGVGRDDAAFFLEDRMWPVGHFAPSVVSLFSALAVGVTKVSWVALQVPPSANPEYAKVTRSVYSTSWLPLLRAMLQYANRTRGWSINWLNEKQVLQWGDRRSRGFKVGQPSCFKTLFVRGPTQAREPKGCGCRSVYDVDWFRSREAVRAWREFLAGEPWWLTAPGSRASLLQVRRPVVGSGDGGGEDRGENGTAVVADDARQETGSLQRDGGDSGVGKGSWKSPRLAIISRRGIDRRNLVNGVEVEAAVRRACESFVREQHRRRSNNDNNDDVSSGGSCDVATAEPDWGAGFRVVCDWFARLDVLVSHFGSTNVNVWCMREGSALIEIHTWAIRQYHPTGSTYGLLATQMGVRFRPVEAELTPSPTKDDLELAKKKSRFFVQRMYQANVTVHIPSLEHEVSEALASLLAAGDCRLGAA